MEALFLCLLLATYGDTNCALQDKLKRCSVFELFRELGYRVRLATQVGTNALVRICDFIFRYEGYLTSIHARSSQLHIHGEGACLSLHSSVAVQGDAMSYIITASAYRLR